MNTTFADIFRAFDRLVTALFVGHPRKLDNTRKWRNRYIDAVR